MTNYARMYRFGITPWERYATAAASSIAALLDREETGRSRPLGRALDLGCGRGLYTPELARRGWEAVGIDYVPAAIEAAAAKSQGVDGLSYVVGDRGPGLADEQVRTAVVQAAPTHLEPHHPVSSRQQRRPTEET